MAQLVLLVVAAAWAAVLIPPMLRSRVDNRPNSSVTDFRRQLSTLQSTSTPRMRTIGRPLASSPLHRPAAAGRPGHAHHRQAELHATTTRSRPAGPRPAERASQATFRTHGGSEPAHRQTHMDRPHHERSATQSVTPRSDVRRRRATCCSCWSSPRLARCSWRRPPRRPCFCTCSPWRSSPCAATCTCSPSCANVRHPAGATAGSNRADRSVGHPSNGGADS